MTIEIPEGIQMRVELAFEHLYGANHKERGPILVEEACKKFIRDSVIEAERRMAQAKAENEIKI